MVLAPVASPSSPSVRFTPLLVPAIMRLAHRTNRTTPTQGRVELTSRSRLVSRTEEMTVEAGVRPREFWNCRTSREKIRPTIPCPASFCHERRPRLRCLEILM